MFSPLVFITASSDKDKTYVYIKIIWLPVSPEVTLAGIQQRYQTINMSKSHHYKVQKHKVHKILFYIFIYIKFIWLSIILGGQLVWSSQQG